MKRDCNFVANVFTLRLLQLLRWIAPNRHDPWSEMASCGPKGSGAVSPVAGRLLSHLGAS